MNPLPLTHAIKSLDKALNGHEGASETQIKLQLPPYYALARELDSIRGPITSVIRETTMPTSIRIGRILILPV